MGFARASGEHGLAYHWRTSTVAERTPDEHAMVLTQLLDLEGLDLRTAVTDDRHLLLGAVGDDPAAAHGRIAGSPTSTSRCIGPGTKSGMPILYENPREVGADRIADAVGAYDLYPGASIVVDMGTATVFDVDQPTRASTWAGRSRPGVAISLEALYTHAAALRSVELVRPRSVIGRSTVESIQSGVLYGFAAQVDGIVERIFDEIGEATVIGTGRARGLDRAPHAPRADHRTVVDPSRIAYRA